MHIQAVAGGTGQLAAQMAKICGFKVLGACSTGKVPVAEALGACDAVVDYTKQDVDSCSIYRQRSH